MTHYHQLKLHNHLQPPTYTIKAATMSQYYPERSHNNPKQTNTSYHQSICNHPLPSLINHYHYDKLHSEPQLYKTTHKQSTTTHHYPERSSSDPQPPTTTIKASTLTLYRPVKTQNNQE